VEIESLSHHQGNGIPFHSNLRGWSGPSLLAMTLFWKHCLGGTSRNAQTEMPACPSLMLWTGPSTGIAICQYAVGIEEQWR
jgi:hypothetical protein